MLTDLQLMNIHISALFTQNNERQLLFVNEPENASVQAPRLFLGRTGEGNVWRFRAGLAENLRAELNALCADEPPLERIDALPRHLESYIRILESDTPVDKLVMGPAYYFPQSLSLLPSPVKLIAVTEQNAEILQDGFEDFISELPSWQPFIALVEGDRTVSICRSARITCDAHEAGVETRPEFRGKGYAKKVVMEWARLVRSADAIPMYSTSWDNRASQAVARKLDLKFYGADFQIF